MNHKKLPIVPILIMVEVKFDLPIFMRHLIYKIGRIKIVIVITLLATFLAMSLGYFLHYFQEVAFDQAALLRTIIIPLIVAPLLSWYLVGLFLRVIELEQTMSEWALFDQLTGLFNRRAFLHRAEQEYQLAKRYNETLGVLILDLDHFKTINDKYSHKAGDMILKDFGQLVSTTIRQSDTCGRIGGEEFGFILPKASQAQCQAFSEKLLKAIEERTVSYEGTIIKYTATIGITVSYPKNDFKIDNLIHHADQALYEAKSAGRNCYKVSSISATHCAQSVP